MKQSTTQDRAYLTECLEFHERRRFECIESYNPEGEIYHRAQVKWFKAKLQGYFREAPIPEPARSMMPSNPSLEFKATRIPAPPIGEPIHQVEPVKSAPWYARLYNKLRGL